MLRGRHDKTVRAAVVCGVWFGLTILGVARLHAAEKRDLGRIRGYALGAAPSVSQPSRTDDAVADAIAIRLRERLADVSAARKRSEQLRRASRSTAAVTTGAERVEVRTRRGVGTPMQIRLDVPTASARGAGTADESPGDARAFLRRYRETLRIDDPDSELRLTSSQRDTLGHRHLRFGQSYRGMPVWPGELLVHLDPAGNVVMLDGAFAPTPRDVATNPALSADAAVARARAAVRGGAQAVSSAAQLIVYAPNTGAPRLAWKVGLNVSLASDWVVIVDAADGTVLNAFNEVMDFDVAGSGEDVFGDTRPLHVWNQSGTFFMNDTSKPMFDPTSTPPAADTTVGGIVVQDARNQPPDPFNDPFPPMFDVTSKSATAWDLPEAVSAAFNLSHVYDYYLQRHGRNSIDANGGSIYAVVRVGQNFDNAFWSNAVSTMFFGDAEPFAGALDVVGHELTHGVTRNSANLISQSQSGAMNEGFSDCFGEAIEAFTFGGPDWELSGQLPTLFRNVADPHATGNPSKLSELVVTDSDRGGAHVNSTILSHAFYLLADGLNGAIGVGDAERIFYRALTTHLVSNSQFVDARLACVSSAEELFGAGSRQALTTAEAFDAVEIFGGRGTPQPSPFPPVSGVDATLFLSFDVEAQAYFLGRREESLGDPVTGVQLVQTAVAPARPAVTGDGRLAVFVNADSDVCFVLTDGTKINPQDQTTEECLGFPGFISSVAVAPDGERFGFVLLDALGNPDNKIRIIDTGPAGGTRSFTLKAPTLDGASTDTVVNADTMDFTADGRLLVYDALNQLTVSDGRQLARWSIFALDLDTETTETIVPPTVGFDIAYPAISQTSDNFLTFDALDQEAQESSVLAVNLTTGSVEISAKIPGGFGVPSYSGDDAALIYSQNDNTATEFSLMRQTLAADRVTPVGAPTRWLADADFGVVYRRGAFVGPAACGQDCNRDAAVHADDLLMMVRIALGGQTSSLCPGADTNSDGTLTVDEVLGGVNAAATNCSSG